MKDFFKQNFAIVIAFSLPVILITGIALSAYLPSLFISTDYNFVYSSCTDGSNNYYYRCDNYLQKRYSVVDGNLVVNDIDPELDANNNRIPDVQENYSARLFLHDTHNNETREITVEEAQSLRLSELITSPDGVSVSSEYDRGADFFLFVGGSTYGHYLVKGNAKSKLNLINSEDRYYYRDNFQFIGWVLPGRK